LKIRERLTRWLIDEYDGWRMMWVRGAAGTGKSAVAQSFGDSCQEEERHGASYFFSRATGRNRFETVVPTLAFQLANTIPEYRSLVAHQLADNPLLLRKSPPVQFRKLIIEPFATLQRRRPRKPFVIIMDGLDECEGEGAQREILDMINNAVRSNPDLPLRWLIFSRPEANLKNAFSRNILCGREELIIDAECRQDVERYVRDRLVQIKNVYNDVTPAEWPPQNKLQELLDAVSGLFTLASKCLNYIGDPDKADPLSRLDSLLMSMHRSQDVLPRNPLESLDFLYSRILEKIPPTVYKSTKRILAYMSHRDELDGINCLHSAQVLGNFLRLDQLAFYGAVRGLHSVMAIPEPDDAAECQLRFYHASFPDFLLDPNRSGNFFIGKQDAVADIVQSGVYWCEVDATHFHTRDGKPDSKEVLYDRYSYEY
jgi:hypothetical protein